MSDLAFLVIAVVTVGGAILSLESSEIVYGAVALAISFFGIASLFFLLGASYIAVFQITVYIGAIAVLILFTVMLVRQEKWVEEKVSPIAKIAGILTAFAIALSLVLSIIISRLYTVSSQIKNISFLQIGQLLSRDFAPVMEILALVLAASVIGAILLAKVERDEGE